MSLLSVRVVPSLLKCEKRLIYRILSNEWKRIARIENCAREEEYIPFSLLHVFYTQLQFEVPLHSAMDRSF